jgi:hypothetical protein
MEPTQAMRTLAESLRQGDARSVNPRSHGIERPLPESHPTASDSLDTRGLRLTSSRSGEASGHHVEGARGQGQTQWGDLLGRSPGVLVLPFKLNDRQPDPSSCRFADVLSRSLEAIGRVRVLGSPGLVCEEKHYGSSTASVDEIVAAGRRAGAGHVVVGAFVSIRQTARLWAQIYDVQLGQRGGWTRVEGDSGQVFQLVDLL